MAEPNNIIVQTVSWDSPPEKPVVINTVSWDDPVTKQQPKDEYFKSLPVPTLGISIPVISPQTAKPELKEKGFFDSVSEGIKTLWDYFNDENPEKTGIKSPFYEDYEDPARVKELEANEYYDKTDTPLKQKNLKDVRREFKGYTEDQGVSGKGPNYTNVIENALDLYDQGSFVFNPALNLKIPTLTPPKTLSPSPTARQDAQRDAPQELKNLGFDYVTGDDGQVVLQQVSPSVYSERDVRKKLTVIKGAYEAKRLGIQTELNDLKESQLEAPAPPPPGVKTTKPNYESLIQTKSKELENLDRQYGEIVGVYGTIANSPTYVGSNKVINDPYKKLNEAPKDTPIDYKGITESLKQAIGEIKNIQSDPELQKKMLERGLSYTYIDDDHAYFQETQHLKDPRSGRNLPQSMVDSWQLNGLVPNINSLKPLMNTDDKIIAQLNEAIQKTQAEGAEKRIPVEEIDAVINKSGLFDLLSTWRDFKNAKEELSSTLKKPLETGLKDLVKFKATEKYYDALYKRQPTITGIGYAIRQFDEKVADLLTGNAFPDRQGIRENLFREQYIIPSYDKVIIPDRYVEQEGWDEGVKIKKRIPGVTERTPFTEKESNLSPWNPNPINWDVIAYGATKMTLDIGSLTLAGEALIPITARAVAGAVGSIELGAAIEAAGAAGGLKNIGYGWRAANIGGQVAKQVLPRFTGIVLPTMVVFGPENLRAEMENKALTEEEAYKLSALRSLAEGVAFSISPVEMGKMGYRALVGETANAAEEAAYRLLIEKGLGKKLTDKSYNFLFNAKAFGKAVALSYGETAANLIGQLEMSLVANAAINKYVQNRYNPKYRDPERELTVENIVDTAVEALGTAIPFSLMHVGPKFQQTRFAREAALYRIAQSPEWYLNRINEELKSPSSTIDANEALRRKTLIDQTKQIYDSMKEDFAKIGSDPDLTPENKHNKRFELFKNKLKQEGLKEELLKDIPDAEKTKILEELDKTAQEYQEVLKFREKFDKLSPDEKLKVESNVEFNKYIKDNLNPELIKRYNVEDYEARLNELRELAKAADNQYLAVRYQEAANALELIIADSKFKESQDPRIMQERVSEFTDWLEDRIARANESFDGILRTSEEGIFTESDRYDYIKDFVEEGMSTQQKFLYDKHIDLIEAEQARRRGEVPEEPYELAEPVEFIEAPVDKVKPQQEVDTGELKEDLDQDTPGTKERIEAIAKKELGQPLNDTEWLQSLEGEVDSEMLDKFSKITLDEVATHFTDNKLDAAKIIGNALPAEIATRIEKAVYDKSGKVIDITALTPDQIKNDFGINLYTGEVFAPVIPDAPVVSEQVLKDRTTKQTLEYRALNEKPEDVKKDNRTSEARVYKLADIDINQEGKIQYHGKKLISASGLFAYTAVEAEENADTGKWTKKDNTLNPEYAPLHSSKFYQEGTAITIVLEDFSIPGVERVNSLFVEENKKKYFENRELVEQYNFITDEEYNALGEDPDNFAIIKILDKDGKVISYVHDLSFARSGRIVVYIYRPNQEPIFNLGPAYRNLITYRKELLKALRANGGKLEGIIDGSTIGSRSIRADEKFVPVRQAFINPGVLKEITVVTSPERYRIKNKMLENWEEIVPGSAIAPVQTPNGKWYGIVLYRNPVGKERGKGVENVLNFYVDYVDATKRDDTAKVAKLDKVAEEIISKMGGEYKYDIRTSDGLRNYLSNIVYIGEQASKYTKPGPDRKDLSGVPFIDFDSTENTLTYSSKRLLEDIDENQRLSTFAALNDAGIYKQVFFDKDGKKNPGVARFFKDFARWVESRPMNFKTENFEITTNFNLPLLEKIGEDYSMMDVKEAVTSGKSFQDYLVNNLKTDNLEHQIINKDGSTEFVYFEQPTKSFKATVPPPPTPDIPEVTTIEERLPVEDFVDKFKAATTYAEAAILAKEGLKKYPGIANYINAKIKSLRPSMTYKEKLAEFEETWKDHNNLAEMLVRYNNLSRKEKNKSADLHNRINLLAEQLGYTAAKTSSGNFKITKDGKVIKAKSYPSELLPVVDGKITIYGESVGAKDAENFKVEIARDKYTPHADFGLSLEDLKRGFNQLAKGDLNKIAAQNILKKIAEWKRQGYVDLIQGSGAFILREGVSYEDYVKSPGINVDNYLDYIEEVNKLPNPEDLNKEDFDKLAADYDTWYKSLTPEQQEQHLKEYEEYTNLETESELYADEELIEEVSKLPELPEGYETAAYRETFESIEEFKPERKEEILTNFAKKYKMTELEARTYIDEALQEDRNAVIKKLNECY